MIGFFRKRRVAVLLAALAVVLLGCTSGTVCARRYNKAEGQYEIQYKSDVDPDGQGGKRSDWIKVDKNEYNACRIGDEWPACKEGAEVNQPRPKQDDKDRNSKEVCVSSVSHPKVKITNSWSIGRMDVKTEKSAVQGIFERCRLAQSGQTAYLKAEHHADPSTLVCTIWVWEKGKKRLIDTMITQALGDCVVNQRIP